MNTKTIPITFARTASVPPSAGKIRDEEAANIPGLVSSPAGTGKKGQKEKNQKAGRRRLFGLPGKKKRSSTPSVLLPQAPDATTHQWFFTLMCMNIPIVGWFYLMYLAFNKKHTGRRSFARAYLLYKLLFLVLAAAILGALVYVGLEIADQLLAYMEML